jgi:hypothetical protein
LLTTSETEPEFFDTQSIIDIEQLEEYVMANRETMISDQSDDFTIDISKLKTTQSRSKPAVSQF